MNWDQIESSWEQYKGDVQEQWSKLSSNQLDFIAGDRDTLVQEIGKIYAISEHAAEWQLSGWQARLSAQKPVMTAESKVTGIANWWQQSKSAIFQ